MLFPNHSLRCKIGPLLASTKRSVLWHRFCRSPLWSGIVFQALFEFRRIGLSAQKTIIDPFCDWPTSRGNIIRNYCLGTTFCNQIRTWHGCGGVRWNAGSTVWWHLFVTVDRSPRTSFNNFSIKTELSFQWILKRHDWWMLATVVIPSTCTSLTLLTRGPW